MQLFSRSWAREVAGLILFSCAASAVAQNWSVARNSRFEVYSQAGPDSARTAVNYFEQLRTFFLAQGFSGNAEGRARVRVIGFKSDQNYASFQLRPGADAFYVATESQDYIVLPGLDSRRFGMAAHEYAHLVLHASKLRLPLWLNEGLAEYFSTVHMTARGSEIGGDLPERSQALANQKWIALRELFAADSAWLARQSRQQAAMFYAESWALADLLISSKAYAAYFRQFVTALDQGATTADALVRTYGKAPDVLASEARTYRSVASVLPLFPHPADRVEAFAVSDYQTRWVLAKLLAADRQYARSETLLRELAREKPADGNIFVELGNSALRRGDRAEAVANWRIAIQKGIADAALCYQYAMLAGEQNVPESEIREALERAVALNPAYDDARYALALAENNAGKFGAALDQLQAMRAPARGRAFAYWSATAYALTELDRREEAKDAARKALECAGTAAEHTQALQLSYIASTDLTVQLVDDGNGQPRMVTTRVPHGTTDFNPFIKPGDHLIRAEAKLREVRCVAGRLTGFVVETTAGLLRLTVADPTHVLMRNGPPEFNCGAQKEESVRVEYAAAPSGQGGTLRGMEFR